MQFLQNDYSKNNISIISQCVGINNIDIVFYDTDLPGDLKSELFDSSIAFVTWSPDYKTISDVNWRIKSKTYTNILLDNDFDCFNEEVNWLFRLEITELNIYKKKYTDLFLIMAIEKLLEHEEFVKLKIFYRMSFKNTKKLIYYLH